MEIELGPLFVGGLLAGWGVAVPLGAIGVLLVREALAVGFGAGAIAALAVALVDGLYCVAALAIGAVAAPVLDSWGAAPAVGAGLILLLLGALGLRRRPAAAQPRDKPPR
ncbi:lysine transporter LysE, partial [Cryobacterium sp. TMB3-12]